MTNIVQEYEKEAIEALTKDKKIPDFSAGDKIIVYNKIPGKSGTQREYAFKGTCIKRRNRGLRSSFNIHKISSNNVTVEKNFMLYSPQIRIEVEKRRKVRRARIYYYRDRRGKGTRLKEIRKDNKVKVE